jgi:hypothetical protein
MRTVHSFTGLAATCVLLAMVGCGGGSSQGGDPLVLGRAAIQSLASGESTTSRSRLNDALGLFDRVIAANPDSSEARFWKAVCLVGIVGMDVSGVSSSSPAEAVSGRPGWDEPGGGEGWTAPDPGDGDIPAAPPDHDGPVPPVEPPHRLGLLWNLREAVANPFTLLTVLAPVADVRMGLPAMYGFVGDDFGDQQAAMARLDEADRLLALVESDAGFAASLPAWHDRQAELKIGLPEVHLFHALVHTLRAQLALSMAYVRSAGPQVDAPFTDVRPALYPDWNPFKRLDRNGDGVLSPDEYLPPNPYLTLRDGGYLTVARDAMLASAAHAEEGCSGVLARTDSDGWLINNVSPMREALTEMRDHAVPLLRQAADGPVEVLVPHYEPPPMDGSSVPPAPCAREGRITFDLDPGDCVGWGPPRIVMRKFRINLAAWFALPPPDLKAFAPFVGLNADGWPDPAQVRLPDPTFGGLFPDGVNPEDLLFGAAIAVPMLGR